MKQRLPPCSSARCAGTHVGLRRMALQSIRRPEVAQGPLHDALIEMYPEEYGRMIEMSETDAQRTGHKMVVVMSIRSLWANKAVSYRPSLFYSRLLETGLDEEWRRWKASPRVITYVTRSGKAVVFPEDIP